MFVCLWVESLLLVTDYKENMILGNNWQNEGNTASSLENLVDSGSQVGKKTLADRQTHDTVALSPAKIRLRVGSKATQTNCSEGLKIAASKSRERYWDRQQILETPELALEKDFTCGHWHLEFIGSKEVGRLLLLSGCYSKDPKLRRIISDWPSLILLS